ncbi:MAG: S8/S53 family peptidase [Alphaproteobacteria bacterium]|nr:S8/S53 family peptidase [Alphaproteobacteria bacterium]
MKLRAPYPFWNNKHVQANDLPTPEQISQDDYATLRLKGVDCSQLDLSAYDPQLIEFDENTIWPTDLAKMPKDFDPKETMALGKRLLNVQALHKKGLTGKGLSIAIIDQFLSDHTEYHDNLVHYEEIGFDQPHYEENHETMHGSMHGSAVASLAVGKTCGVAPDAKLYYFAANNHVDANNKFISMNSKDYDKKGSSHNYARALERIIEINKELVQKGEKPIQVVSISWGAMHKRDKTGEWAKAMEHAQQNGLAVLNASCFEGTSFWTFALDRKYNQPTQEGKNYFLPRWFVNIALPHLKKEAKKGLLAFPAGHITTASEIGSDKFVHYARADYSWKTPYIAGLFVLARQINPSVTPQQFYEATVATSALGKDGIARVPNLLQLMNFLENEYTLNIKRQAIKTTTALPQTHSKLFNFIKNKVQQRKAKKTPTKEASR